MKPPGEITAAAPSGIRARLARAGVSLALVAAIIGGALYGYNYLVETRQEVPRRPPVERVWTVETIPVAYTDHRPTLVTYGTATPARRVAMRALVSGEVVEVGEALREGGIVAEGDLLLRIDPFEYEGAVTEARANLAETRARLVEIEAEIAQERDALVNARTQLEIARRDLERAEALRGRGTVSEKTVDDRLLLVTQRGEMVTQRQNQLAVYRARAEQQRASLSRLEWRLRQAERNLANTTLRAPFAAFVSSINAEVGRLVGVNDAVATLIDATALDVRFVLSDSEFGRIADDAGSVTGRPVTVIWQAGDTPRSFAATVERVTAEIDAARGGVEVFARIAEDDLRAARLLPRPGAFVEVSIEDKAYRDAARIPATAIYGTDTVYVVEDERLVPRAIAIIGRAGSDLLVRGELVQGERLVVTRITEAGTGLKVREQDSADAAPAPMAGTDGGAGG